MSIVTANFTDWSYQEMKEACTMLNYYLDNDYDISPLFDKTSLTLNYNPESNVVFISNNEYQSLIENDNSGLLEVLHSTPFNGIEIFDTEIVELINKGSVNANYHGNLSMDELSGEDVQYLRDVYNQLMEQKYFIKRAKNYNDLIVSGNVTNSEVQHVMESKNTIKKNSLSKLLIENLKNKSKKK